MAEAGARASLEVSPAPGRVRDRLAAGTAYGWRAVPGFPGFPRDTDPVIVFDGVCVLCSRFARFVAMRDKGRFRFVAAQSRLGQALMRYYNLEPDAFETNLLVEAGRASGKLDAVTGILTHLGPGWRFAANLMRRLPIPLADWIYDRVACNRYALFGRHDACVRPGPEWRDRIVDGE